MSVNCQTCGALAVPVSEVEIEIARRKPVPPIFASVPLGRERLAVIAAADKVEARVARMEKALHLAKTYIKYQDEAPDNVLVEIELILKGEG